MVSVGTVSDSDVLHVGLVDVFFLFFRRVPVPLLAFSIFVWLGVLECAQRVGDCFKPRIQHAEFKTAYEFICFYFA